MAMMLSNRMIYIGVDPSLTSTGIVVLKEDGSLWATVNVTHTIMKRKNAANEGRFVALFVDKPKSLYNPFPIKKTYVLEPNGNIRQVKVLYEIMKEVFEALSVLLAAEQKQEKKQFGLDHCKVAVEIPFGNHKGAAAKVDRVFAAVSLAIIHAAPIQIACGSWDVYEFNPQEVKKYITGKGNCKKELVLKEVFKRFGYDTNITDLADAYAVAKLLEHRTTEV